VDEDLVILRAPRKNDVYSLDLKNIIPSGGVTCLVAKATNDEDFMPSVTLPSKIFTFMRKHSPKFSCRITPLTPSMLEVVTALAAEEEHIQDTASFHGTATPHDSDAVQGTDTLQVVKHHAFWVESQNLKKQKRRRKKQRKKVSSVKLGRNKEEGTLSEEHNVQEEDTADPFFDDIADKDAAVNPDLERKSDETEE
ncbi:hypothetical protein Tco_0136468, partial [Tanacetum coccineum]